MKNVRICVLEVAYDEKSAERYLADGSKAGPCPYFREGDRFFYEGGA